MRTRERTPLAVALGVTLLLAGCIDAGFMDAPDWARGHTLEVWNPTGEAVNVHVMVDREGRTGILVDDVTLDPYASEKWTLEKANGPYRFRLHGPDGAELDETVRLGNGGAVNVTVQRGEFRFTAVGTA